jgi:hypothetical protein
MENTQYQVARSQTTVMFTPIDFFEEGPSKDQDIYFVRAFLPYFLAH